MSPLHVIGGILAVAALACALIPLALVALVLGGIERVMAAIRGRLAAGRERAEDMARMRQELQAARRARALLMRCLSPEQREHFRQCGRFWVDVPGRGRFAISSERAFNVTGSHQRYCLLVPGVPLCDQLLAQKLLLERDPERFFAVANVR